MKMEWQLRGRSFVLVAGYALFFPEFYVYNIIYKIEKKIDAKCQKGNKCLVYDKC